MKATGLRGPAMFSGLPGGFWLLWTGTLVNRLGTMVLPFMTLYLQTVRGLPLTTVGVLMALFGGGQVLSQLIGGALTDRGGRLPTLTGSLLASATVMVLLGQAESLLALATGIFLLGLVVDAYRPAATSLIADLVPQRDRARAYGLMFWAVGLGFSVATLLGGTIYELGPRWLFWVNALATVAFALLIIGWWRRGTVPRERPTGKREDGGTFGAVLKDRPMVVYCLVTLVYGIVHFQSITTLPLVMHADGLDARAYGTLMALNCLIIVVAQPVVSARAGNWDLTTVFGAGVLLLGLGFGIGGLASSLAGYACSVLVWTAGEIAMVSVGQTIVIGLAPEHSRGRYSGLWGTSWGGAAAMLGPLIGTSLLAGGAGLLWSTCLASCALGALVMWTLRGEIRRRCAVTEEEHAHDR
ncbi:MDR family MFS transporter [Nonomuraea cavernae]|uniref:MFS transporter n=1 Tax=Nonomuraea cavernae TaxID=2045107 RepID=A0A917YR41_9ACTN|nr:MFS transporter [Nonomuraea cavernae]MCA2183592.1 MFS transporter [Nonomuraea cavernae]GGO60766.1 MFS transporter [Nonomuraea cavernae]